MDCGGTATSFDIQEVFKSAWRYRGRHLYPAANISNLSAEYFQISMYIAGASGALCFGFLLISCYSYLLFSWEYSDISYLILVPQQGYKQGNRMKKSGLMLSAHPVKLSHIRFKWQPCEWQSHLLTGLGTFFKSLRQKLVSIMHVLWTCTICTPYVRSFHKQLSL